MLTKVPMDGSKCQIHDPIWLPTIKDIVEMGLLELEIGSRFSSGRKGLHSLCSSELPFACDEKENSPLSTHFQTTLPTTSTQ